jgi:nitrous oxide reductase accessory protein NosL
MRITSRSIGVVAAIVAALVGVGGVSPGWSATLFALPDGSKVDLSKPCPVCGMIVGGGLESQATYAYRAGRLTGFGGAAAAVFKDGHVVGFEGARCLFIYNSLPKRFGIDVGNIVHRYVTDFNTKKLTDVNKAFLVLGSRVNGFMGPDLIAFPSRQEAEKFSSEYGGKRIVEPGTVGIKDVERQTGPPKK